MTDLHILSDQVSDFWKWPKNIFLPQKGVYKYDFLDFLKPKWGGGLIRSTKTQFKNLKFGMVSIGTNYFL